jgi:hypothetical protein
VTDGERRYFQILGVLGALSLMTIGGTAALERFVGPAWEVFPSLASQPASAQVREASQPPMASDQPGTSPELRLEVDPVEWSLPGDGLPCVAALEPPADHSSRWLPPLTLDGDELGCFAFD